MTSSQKTFRVFVSSTFADMKAERNALQERVFPELQRLCEQSGCRFQAVDLRWGVSEEAALDQQTMNICLTELRRCQDVSPRPNFMILLGDRYGWMPIPPQIEAAEFEQISSQADESGNRLLDDWYRLDTNAVPPEYVLRPRKDDIAAEADYASWGETEQRLRAIFLDAIKSLGWPVDDGRRIKYECSATHQEIIEGALKLQSGHEHVFAYLRTITNLEALPTSSDYTDAGTAEARRLKETISRIPGIALMSCDVNWDGTALETRIDEFVAAALASLRRIIEEELRQLKDVDDLTRTNVAHEEFGRDRCRLFVGRREILAHVAAYIEGDSTSPLVLYGPGGSGKSALMAKASLEAERAKIKTRVIRRFIGATPESTDIRWLLENLIRQITRVYNGDADTIPTEYKDLMEELPKRLQLVTDTEPLIIFLDALDMLGTANNAHSLNWLPSTLPPHVKIIVSVLEHEGTHGECLISGQRKFSGEFMIRLEDMKVEEGEEVMLKWLSEAYSRKKRALTEEQMKYVLTCFEGCPRPLYLKLAFEQARRWKSFDGTATLAANISGIFKDVLNRLKDKRQHGDILVTTFLSLLAASRHGLSEAEVIELLSGDDSVMADLKTRSARSPEATGIPDVVWLRFYYDLSPYLMEVAAYKTALFKFFHRELDETVKRDYLLPEYHARLARYFRRKADPAGDCTWSGNYVHGLAEIAWQQTKSGTMWDELEAVLTDLLFIQAKCTAGLTSELVDDYKAALELVPEKYKDCIGAFERVFLLQLHHLYQRPDLAFQQMYNELQWQKGQVKDLVEKARQKFIEKGGRFLHQYRTPKIIRSNLIMTLAGHTLDTTFCAYSPDGSRIVSASRDETLKIWDAETGKEIMTLTGHSGYVISCAYSPDGKHIVSASWDNSLKIWNAETGKVIMTLTGHSGWVNSCAYSPDGKRIVSASYDETLKIWDAETGKEIATLTGHSNYVKSCAYSPDGKHIVSASYDETLKIWNAETGKVIMTLTGHIHYVTSCAYSPDGKRIISASLDYTLKIWDAETGNEVATLTGHSQSVNSCAYSPDGKRIVSTSSDETFKIWDAETGEEIMTLTGHSSEVKSCAYSPDGKRIVSASSDETLKIWDTETGKEIMTLTGHSNYVKSCAYSPDGKRIVSASDDKTLKIWNAETGNEVATLTGHSQSINCCAYSPDGKRIVSASFDKTLKIWDAETGEEIATLTGHSSDVDSCAYSPDGKRIVSSSLDYTLKIWDAEIGEEIITLTGHSGWVDSCAYSPDGKRIVSSSWDYTLKISLHGESMRKTRAALTHAAKP